MHNAQCSLWSTRAVSDCSFKTHTYHVRRLPAGSLMQYVRFRTRRIKAEKAKEKKKRKNRRQSGHVSKVDESRNNANMCSVHMDGVEDHMLAEHNDISENDKKLHRRRAFPGNIEYLALITRALQHRFHGVLLRTLEIVQCSFCTICAPHIHTYSSWWTFTNRTQELVERRVRF